MKASRRLIAMSLGLIAFLLGWTANATAAPFAYVANFGSDDVSVIDTARNQVISTVPVGNGPFYTAVNAQGTRVYVTNRDSDTVSVINTQTNMVVDTVAVGDGPIGVAVHPDGTRVYVGNFNDGTLSVIDTAKIGTGEDPIIARVPLGGFPWGVAVHPDGSRVYVTKTSLFGDGTVSVIDTASNNATAIIAVGPEPRDVAVHPAGTRLYFVSPSSISVIDTASHGIIATIPADDPLGVGVHPDGTRVYVTVEEDADIGNGPLYMIDTATNNVIDRLPVGKHHFDVAVTPTGTHAYVTNHLGAAVSVVDAATSSYSVVGTIPVGTFPIGIAIGPPPPARSRVGLLGGTPQHPEPPPEDIPPGGGTTRIPLGRVFFVELRDANGMPVESTFTLGTAVAEPAITEATLFKENVVIEFDRATSSETKLFQAVHLGNVTLNITPTPPSAVPPVNLQIEVTRPDRLGNAANQFDAQFIEFGHRTGIPPQILKGVSRRESGPNLNPLAYRYEPLQDLQVISGGKNLRVTELPYPLYRLATKADTRNAALGEGANIKKPDDISPRSIYCISRDGVLRNISNDDQFVSAVEIFQRNDSLFGLLCPGFRHQRWSDPENASPNVIAQIRNTPSLLEFTAQTPLAASYGIMQMTYIRAIRPLQWKGTKTSGPCFRFPENCNPSFLFDTDGNIAVGGGTLALASDNLIIGFTTRNPGVSTTDPNFADKSLLDAAFRNMLRSYNPGKTTYAAEVLGFSQEFLPVREAAIFQ